MNKLFNTAKKEAKEANIDLDRLDVGRIEKGTICHFYTIKDGVTAYHFGYHSIFNLIRQTKEELAVKERAKELVLR